jgi:hypothetical protein
MIQEKKSFYLLSGADHDNTLLNEGIMESSVINGSGDALFPFPEAGLIPICVLDQGNVYEGNIHVSMGISIVVLLEACTGLLEPVNLARLNPVIARVVTLVRRIRVCVEEVDCQGGMVVVTTSQDFNIVVPDAVDVCGASS